MKFVFALAAFAFCAFAQNKSQDKFCDNQVNRNSATALLAAMDHDLDQIEHGKDACGSFTDYFAVNAADALTARASRKEIDRRIVRLLGLAEKRMNLRGLKPAVSSSFR